MILCWFQNAAFHQIRPLMQKSFFRLKSCTISRVSKKELHLRLRVYIIYMYYMCTVHVYVFVCDVLIPTCCHVVQSSTSSLPLKIAWQASCSFRHYFEGPEEELYSLTCFMSLDQLHRLHSLSQSAVEHSHEECVAIGFLILWFRYVFFSWWVLGIISQFTWSLNLFQVECVPSFIWFLDTIRWYIV